MLKVERAMLAYIQCLHTSMDFSAFRWALGTLSSCLAAISALLAKPRCTLCAWQLHSVLLPLRLDHGECSPHSFPYTLLCPRDIVLPPHHALLYPSWLSKLHGARGVTNHGTILTQPRWRCSSYKSVCPSPVLEHFSSISCCIIRGYQHGILDKKPKIFTGLSNVVIHLCPGFIYY